jgi:hypothetical protein
LKEIPFPKSQDYRDKHAIIYSHLRSSFRKKALQEGRRFELETCDAGMQNCQKILLSEKSQVK